MLGRGQLRRCRERKAALLRQSAAHRSVLSEEARALRPVAGWVDLGIEVVHKVRAGWSVLAPLFSFWQMKKEGSSGLMQKLAGGISIARSLAGLWQNR